MTRPSRMRCISILSRNDDTDLDSFFCFLYEGFEDVIAGEEIGVLYMDRFGGCLYGEPYKIFQI